MRTNLLVLSMIERASRPSQLMVKVRPCPIPVTCRRGNARTAYYGTGDKFAQAMARAYGE